MVWGVSSRDGEEQARVEHPKWWRFHSFFPMLRMMEVQGVIAATRRPSKRFITCCQV